MKKANSLINETSPYLLQHAYNPVDWYPWSEDIFEIAKRENKLVLISIGYSACHWCHVMEHESFENPEVAEIMNKYFINVKVDREERPDVDQVYMTAVQLMTQRGGWPLNCITLPNGQPIYGGTYFPKEQWMNILQSLQHIFVTDLPKVTEYAEKLHEGIVNSELIDLPAPQVTFGADKLDEMITRWKRQFDKLEGGNNKAPKFPLPNNLQFLLNYGTTKNDETVLKQVELTLDKMAMGGIYDQVGGGFARYSVDMLWKVPHFEKMLYDNAQLLSVYSEAYKYFKKPLYKRVIQQTIDWLQREMLHEEGAYFAALDADSEGEEGKFYVWKLEEYEQILNDDYQFAVDLYSINARGHWEHGNFIPLRVLSDKELQSKYQLTEVELEEKIRKINERLLSERNHRVRPGTDDKLLTSWNALLAIGLCDSYTALHDETLKHAAHKILRWIEQYQLDGLQLWRTRKNGVSRITGFLEDYASIIQAFIRFYEISGVETYLIKAKDLTDYVIEHFQNGDSKMFYFTDKNSTLIARKMDINDNVLPSSNSMMAINLWKLGHFFENQNYIAIAQQQLTNIYDGMEYYGSGYSNWGILLIQQVHGFYQIVISNPDKELDQLHKGYHPNVLVGYASNQIPLGQFKQTENKSYFVCSKEFGCLPPITSFEDVLEIIP